MDVSSDAGARDELDKQAMSQRIKDLERQLAAFDSSGLGLGKTVNVFRSYRNSQPEGVYTKSPEMVTLRPGSEDSPN